MHYFIFQYSNLRYAWHSCCSLSVDGIVDDVGTHLRQEAEVCVIGIAGYSPSVPAS